MTRINKLFAFVCLLCGLVGLFSWPWSSPHTVADDATTNDATANDATPEEAQGHAPRKILRLRANRRQQGATGNAPAADDPQPHSPQPHGPQPHSADPAPAATPDPQGNNAAAAPAASDPATVKRQGPRKPVDWKMVPTVDGVTIGGVRVDSTQPLVHVGSLDSFDKTPGGVRAASRFLEGLSEGDLTAIKDASDLLTRLIPNENFGGEYSSLLWFCDTILASDEEREKLLEDPFVREFYHLFVDNDYAVLMEYLQAKYDLGAPFPRRLEVDRRFRFLEDIMLFNNPRREQWERSSKIVEAVGLKPGDLVIDLGSGPGYFTYKFADIVGEEGVVYAIDVNKEHNEYIRSLNQSLGTTNVIAGPAIEDVVDEGTKVDCVFSCSMYHVAYAAFMREQLEGFIESVKACLKDDGTFVVVDNGLVSDSRLPYHGPRIAKELIVNQLHNYGFRLVSAQQIIPQRYALVFKLAEAVPNYPELLSEDEQKLLGSDWVPIHSRTSLVHITIDGTTRRTRSTEAQEAAELLLKAVNENDKQSAATAKGIYETLIPRERFGGEFTAFHMLCEYLQKSEEERLTLAHDLLSRDYFRVVTENDYDMLKRFINNQLGRPPLPAADGTPFDPDDIKYSAEFIFFNNPNRHLWEHTNRFISLINLKEGEIVADLGCGSGFFTFKFADQVGKSGKVYALEVNLKHLEYVSKYVDRYEIDNVTPILAQFNDVRLPPNSVDTIFMCSVYHAVYAYSMDNVLDELLASMKKALKKNGRLIVIDNTVVGDDEVPYHGGFISKELVVAHLKQYGFEVVRYEEPIRQRYFLEFRLADR